MDLLGNRVNCNAQFRPIVINRISYIFAQETKICWYPLIYNIIIKRFELLSSLLIILLVDCITMGYLF